MVRHNVLKGLYDIEKTIGCGGFAKVKLATHLATGEKVAIKIMDKQMLGDDLRRVKVELEALKSFSHENICQLYQVIETDTHFFIIMEYCSGGELFDHIVEKNRLSESESRLFFRQIVSAVAYLHSLGYAHRDLKPENILLDKTQNLKLIDFGLCAKPEGGIENPLYTSCGSPTYAAPELILGQQYLGQEVDVWAMGVLLYALLAGSLPFDDLNIDNLYRKILNGKYDEPTFVSKESLKLIKSMLQVEPKKRIKVTALLDHHWITLGVLEPVQFKPKSTSKYDSECVQVMAKFMEIDKKVMWSELSKWKFDYNTATYLLLFNKKKKERPLKLISVPGLKNLKPVEKVAIPLLELPVNTTNSLNDYLTPNQKIKFRRKFGNVATSPNWSSPIAGVVTQDATSPFGQFLDPNSARLDGSSRKALKRPRSPFLDEASPLPSKKATPGKETPSCTPDSRKHNGTTETPSSARWMLGSIERSLHKVRHALTPRKALETISITPTVLNNKDLFNVSTTQCKDPELVLTELSRGLEKKGIICKRKGFLLKGSLEPNILHRFGGCSFQLEICYLPDLGLPNISSINSLTPSKSILKNGILQKDLTTPNCKKELHLSSDCDHSKPSENSRDKINTTEGTAFVGIRRKRLKGDSWCYKKVCEEVLALTSTGFNNNLNGLLESSV